MPNEIFDDPDYWANVIPEQDEDHTEEEDEAFEEMEDED